MTQLLDGKTAIIYGGGGIGAGVARSFAREGAKVFLVGRTRETLAAVAQDITSAGGAAEVAVLDVSFNLVTRGDVQGTPLVEMESDDLLRAVVTGLRSNFLTVPRRGA